MKSFLIELIIKLLENVLFLFVVLNFLSMVRCIVNNIINVYFYLEISFIERF